MNTIPSVIRESASISIDQGSDTIGVSKHSIC